MSFIANSFARFAKKYDLSTQIAPYDPYGLVASETLKEARDFIVTVFQGDRSYNFAITFPEYRTELPPIEDILEHLANDAAIMEVFGGKPREFAKYIKRPITVAQAVIDLASSFAGPFKIFIGPEAYAEFTKITEERPYE